jgi:hypothetical protein
MNVSVADPWEMLYEGEADFMFPVGHRDPFCLASNAGFICTRPLYHEGLHVACSSGGRVCTDAWATSSPEMQLPPGF